ncbi:tetratricopeptide repeat protein [Croceitalea marina]|uniref:Tetratricopeptide repeat protein n=1 Tax=Croceitalea marina TaxID=1775166 RepID=A0ABW5MRC0_9FLAO
MKFFIPVLSLFLLLHSPINAQENTEIDSIKNTIPFQHDSLKIKSYVLLFDKKLRKNPDLAKTYLDSANTIYKKTKKTNSAFLLNKLGKYYNRISNYKKVEETTKQLIAINLKNNNQKRLATDYKNLGNIQQKIGNYEEAAKNVLISLKIKEELGFTDKSKGSNYATLVKIYGKINNIEKSNFYNSEWEKVCLKYSDTNRLATVWNNYAVNYKKLKDYNKAATFFRKSAAINEKNKNYVNLANNYNNLGNLYLSKDSLKIAENYLLKALKAGEISDRKNEIAVTLNNLGNLNNRLGNYNKAIDYLERSEKISIEINHRLLLITTYSQFTKAYQGLKKFKNALAYYRARSSIKDSILKKESVDKINELEIKYQTEKKEQQIALQEKEITVLEQQAEIGTLQKILLGGLLVISLIGFYGIRQKLKRNKLEKEKVDAELAFKKKELTTHALHLAKKNEVLESLKQKAQELKEREESKNGYQQLIRTINFDLQDDNNWENFSRYFEEVHKDFNSNVKIKYPQVTSNELRLLALLKMNLSSKEIASILNISGEGIKKARYRLRKKLDITTEDSLQDLVLSL